MESKKVYLKSFGCQMNEADSEQLLGILSQSGYSATEKPEDAQLILLNTCAIREKAEQKVFSDLGRLKALKAGNSGVKIGVAGCVAQSMGKGILAREPAVDFVLGTQSIASLPRLLREAEEGRKGVSLSPLEEKESLRDLAIRSDSIHAYVPIIYGCENYCSYCVVPYVRGPERSRPVQEILSEIQKLVDRGYKEVTLVGQNVNSYGKKGNNSIKFDKLLYLIHETNGLQRIRFVTSHPRDLSKEMVEAMVELPKVCEALHLPVQSGSDRVLEAMNRGYTRAEYLDKLTILRRKISGIAVTTDMIVGFPGESQEDFEETLSLIREAEFDHLFGFRFSARPGTRAEQLPDPVNEEVAAHRLNVLFELQKTISLRKNQAMVGQTVEVLVQGPGKKDPLRLTGRTRTNKIVHFPAKETLVGQLVQVKIDEGLPNCLLGSLPCHDPVSS